MAVAQQLGQVGIDGIVIEASRRAGVEEESWKLTACPVSSRVSDHRAYHSLDVMCY